MPPRKRILRNVLNPPIINGFMPYGQKSENQNLEPINLFFEEYEAIRLSDYSMLNHHQASVKMGVSRPTFTRIYASALQKLAKAFVEGRQIIIKGGKVSFGRNWYHCNACNSHFNITDVDKTDFNCTLCGSQDFKQLNQVYNTINNQTDQCYCVNCGFKQKHESGRKCNQEKCPICNKKLKRR